MDWRKLLKIMGLLLLASTCISIIGYCGYYFQVSLIIWYPFAFIFGCAGGVYVFIKIMEIADL